MHPKIIWITAAALITASAPLLAAAPKLAPADQIKARVTGLRELGAAFKAINDGLRAPAPQTILIQQSARQIRNAAQAMSTWFPKGSGPESGQKTSAKPDIWTKPKDFAAAQLAFSRQADALAKASAGSDIEAIRMETRKLGGTCKACHDQFRVPKT